MNRFEIINKDDRILCEEDCPLLICGHALTYDNTKNAVLAQIKFRNLVRQDIKGVYIRICCKGTDFEDLAPMNEYIYLDMAVEPYKFFGADVPVYLPDYRSRYIKIQCSKIVFQSGEIWLNKNDKYFESELKKETLKNNFDGALNLYSELERELASENISYSELSIPVEQNNIRLCTCGEMNLTSDNECFYCKKTSQWWQDKIDKENLQLSLEHNDEQLRMRREEENRLQNEKRDRYKKLSKIVGIISGGVIFTAAIILILIFTLLPSDKRMGKSIERYLKAGSAAGKELSEEGDSELLQLESDVLKYEGKWFRNKEVEKQFDLFIEGMNIQKDAVQYYESDFAKYDNLRANGIIKTCIATVNMQELGVINLDQDLYEDYAITYLQDIIGKALSGDVTFRPNGRGEYYLPIKVTNSTMLDLTDIVVGVWWNGELVTIDLDEWNSGEEVSMNVYIPTDIYNNLEVQIQCTTSIKDYEVKAYRND